MEYDVDLSRVSCGCNAALYMIGMPGVDANGQPFESTDGMHYCDAAKVGGNYCPEFDIMEANAISPTPMTILKCIIANNYYGTFIWS